jgi:hypothetical protein
MMESSEFHDKLAASYMSHSIASTCFGRHLPASTSWNVAFSCGITKMTEFLCEDTDVSRTNLAKDW